MEQAEFRLDDSLSEPKAKGSPAQVERFMQKRAAILDAAAHLFNEKGLKGATLAEVAQRVGLITSSVTYYYRRKEDLATACLLRSLAVLEEIVAAATNDGEAQQDRLRALLRRYFACLAAIIRGERPEIVNFKDTRALTSPHVETVFQAYTEMFRKLRVLLTAPGGERSMANANAHLVLSLMHNARNWIGRYDTDDYGRVADRITDLLLHGLAGAGQDWQVATPAASSDSEPLDDVTREAFLGAAIQLINDQGYRGASVEKISALLKVTKGSFYHHNENKDDLVAACFRHSFKAIARHQCLAAQQAANGFGELGAAMDAIIKLQVSSRGPLLRLTALSALPEAPRAEFAWELERLCERFSNMVVDGMIDGSVRAVDPAITARLIYGVIDAAAELRRWVTTATPETASILFVRPLMIGLFNMPAGRGASEPSA